MNKWSMCIKNYTKRLGEVTWCMALRSRGLDQVVAMQASLHEGTWTSPRISNHLWMCVLDQVYRWMMACIWGGGWVVEELMVRNEDVTKMGRKERRRYQEGILVTTTLLRRLLSNDNVTKKVP